MTKHKALHPWYYVDRLYVLIKERGRGLANIEDSVDVSTRGFDDYIKKEQRKIYYRDQKQQR